MGINKTDMGGLTRFRTPGMIDSDSHSRESIHHAEVFHIPRVLLSHRFSDGDELSWAGGVDPDVR